MRLVSILALLDLTPDSSTTRHPIPILSMGQCSAPSQLSNGVRYVPMRWISMEFASVMRLVSILTLLDSTPDSSTTRHPIPILSTGQCSAPSQLSNGVRYVPTRWISMEFTSVMRLVSILALLDSMPDSSTTRPPISILSTGQCSPSSYLYLGVTYLPSRWIFMEFASVMRLVSILVLLDSMPDSSTTRSPIPI